MTRKVTVTLEVDDNATNEELHEQLCEAIHEGFPAQAVHNIGEVEDVLTPHTQG